MSSERCLRPPIEPAGDLVRQRVTEPIEIDGGVAIVSIAFLVDGAHVLSSDENGLIRRWRVQDGTEVGQPMDAGSRVCDIAVSRDGKWVVGGTADGLVAIWDASNGREVTAFKGHNDWGVRAVDVSAVGTRIATGSDDGTACIWDLSTGERLVGPLEHDGFVVAARFSPDGRLLATATHYHSVHIYNTRDGSLVAISPVKVKSTVNGCLAWATNIQQLFMRSHDGYIQCLDASSGKILYKWRIHGSSDPGCIALAANGRFIVATSRSEVSFWEIATSWKIGSVTIDHCHDGWLVAISENCNLATAGNNKITLRDLHDIFPSPSRDEKLHQSEFQTEKSGRKDNISFEDTIASLRRDLQVREEREVQLEETIEELQDQLSTLKKEKDEANQTIESLCNQYESARSQMTRFECIIHAHEQKHQCETLYTQGYVCEASKKLLDITSKLCETAVTNKFIDDWLSEFRKRCIATLEGVGDEALDAEQCDEALKAYSTALSLAPPTSKPILIKWTRITLVHGSAEVALGAMTQFKLPDYDVYQAVCDVLEGDDRIDEAVECFWQMQLKLGKCMNTQDARVRWELDFRQRCIEKLDKLGDTAVDCSNHGEAIKYFSSALSLNPMGTNAIFVKCCKARVRLLEEALAEAEQEILHDGSSYKGYMRKYAALHGMRRHKEAFEAFETMLSRIEQSPDPNIRKLCQRYVDATSDIRRVVRETVQNVPRVLINTRTGRHYDKMAQAVAFERLPIFDELRSSMTTRIDEARIRREVKQYYRYVMLSHRWEDGEPLFHEVAGISIYDLVSSSPNIKLRTFCTVARGLGFEWIWSDTCCIDKKDNVVLQESLVAMFTWYHGSSLTLIYLRGVWSQSAKSGALRRSIWNTRAWTFQEYVAAETVQFYTEDWKPYLGLTMHNHKDSPDIIAEMQQAAGNLTQDLGVFRPDLRRVREKLYVASMRKTTIVEDVAYSLLGIFNASIPVIYGEGNRAVGRLLDHVLSGSRDITILAWTGRAGNYNSCLPKDLTVYNELVPPHVPQPIGMVDLVRMVTKLRSSFPDLSLALKLYQRVSELASPSFAGPRMQLPCITFPVTKFVHSSVSDSDSRLHVYRATTSAFGDVQIKTTDDLSSLEGFLLVHPWINPLLHPRRDPGVDLATQALRLIARLKQPFGALLLALEWDEQYKRVAADCLIMVQVREGVSLAEVSDSVRTVDVQ